MNDWAKWERILAAATVKVWKHLSRWPDQDTTMVELTRATGVSKTAARQALAELAEYGFIAVDREVDYDPEGT